MQGCLRTLYTLYTLSISYGYSTSARSSSKVSASGPPRHALLNQRQVAKRALLGETPNIPYRSSPRFPLCVHV